LNLLELGKLATVTPHLSLAKICRTQWKYCYQSKKRNIQSSSLELYVTTVATQHSLNGLFPGQPEVNRFIWWRCNNWNSTCANHLYQIPSKINSTDIQTLSVLQAACAFCHPTKCRGI